MTLAARLLPTFAPRLPQFLAVMCAAYLAMLPTNNLVWPRSLVFALMSVAALLEIAMRPRAARERFGAGGGVLLAILVWWLWETASLHWTVEPRFSVREWETELLYGAFVFIAFFVAIRDDHDFRAMTVTLLVSFALLGVLLVATTAITGQFDPEKWHHDVGVWSTHLVEIAPLLLFVLAGFDGTSASRRRVLLFAALLVLLLFNARLTDNRIVWLAFGATFGVAAIAAALHWRTTYMTLPWRFLAPIAALFLLLGFAFADVAQQKAELYYPDSASISGSIENDPRIALWKAALDKIREAPWLGYGFGRGILREVLPAELHDRALTHPHNTFVGQWLEAGVIGLALFVAMLAALVARYVQCIRARDSSVAMAGIVGLSLIAGYVVKNMTDDFFYRSNAKLFWALNAMLLAYAIIRERSLQRGVPPAAD
ncbi:MAG TPA: O-antigen ligase family protein [Casimicrobiaceae bacterium]